ncbi:Uncharacterized protein FKW44_000145, partial [Caligus rogercresseyi]
WPGEFVPKGRKILLAPFLDKFGPMGWGRVLLKSEEGSPYSALIHGSTWSFNID